MIATATLPDPHPDRIGLMLAADVFELDDGEGSAVVEAPPLRPNPVTQDEMDAGSIELF